MVNRIIIFIFFLILCAIPLFSNDLIEHRNLKHNNQIQENNSINKAQAIQFYENTAGQYIDTLHIYSCSDVYTVPLHPHTLFQYIVCYSREQLIQKEENSLLQMLSVYLNEIQINGMPRSIEIETILINRAFMMENNHYKKSLKKINSYLSKEFNVEIKYYSDEEFDELTNSNIDILILPTGYIEGLSSYNISSYQSYSEDEIKFFYNQGIFYSSEYIFFLQNMKKSDFFYNIYNLYTNRLNMDLFKIWFSDFFSIRFFSPDQWRSFYKLFD